MQLSLRFYVECNKIFKCTINKLCVYSPKKCGSAFIFAWNAISLPLFCVASNYISDRALRSTAVSMEKYFQFKMFLASRPTKWYPLCRFNCCPAQVCLIFCDRCKLLSRALQFRIFCSIHHEMWEMPWGSFAGMRILPPMDLLKLLGCKFGETICKLFSSLVAPKSAK